MDSPICHKQIKNIKLPKDTLFLHVSRGDANIIPNGDLIIKPNDHVVVISHIDSVNKLEAAFEEK
jgi:trk system potassium uptake protein TrkA